jgi:hypothetical protein
LSFLKFGTFIFFSNLTNRVILISLFTDLTVKEAAHTCWSKLPLLSWSYHNDSDFNYKNIVYETNENYLDSLRNYNQKLLELINSSDNYGYAYTSEGRIDLGSSSTLSYINNMKDEFEEILKNLNENNKNSKDDIVIDQLDTANLIMAKTFQTNHKQLEQKALNFFKQKNNQTTSRFMNNSEVQKLSTSLDVDYGMAASGITQGDIADQQQYLSNPDNIAAFSSAMVQSEISNQNDAYNSPVKYMGLRAMKPYASKWSGAGFGLMEPSEERISDVSLLPKTNYTL